MLQFYAGEGTRAPKEKKPVKAPALLIRRGAAGLLADQGNLFFFLGKIAKVGFELLTKPSDLIADPGTFGAGGDQERASLEQTFEQSKPLRLC
jgi:hypothetical protein